MQVARWLHLLGIVVWVGGMFFAHMALRPAAQRLPPPQRLTLLVEILTHFFRWVGLAIAAILASGTWMLVGLGGFGQTPTAVHLMTALGVAMVTIFGYVVGGPYRRLAREVAREAWQPAAAAMASTRRLVGLNLILGLVTVTVAMLGQTF